MIFSHEVRLTARRYPTDGEMRLDEMGQRIERLMEHFLLKVGTETKQGGRLFRDPLDGRLWELQCLPAEPHGFTLPELVLLSSAEAEKKYGVGLS